MMNKDIFSKILSYPYFSINSEITKGKVLIIINNLNYWEFSNKNDVKKFIDDLLKEYPDQFFRVPETSNYLNLNFIDFIKIINKRNVSINIENNKSVKFNLTQINDDDFNYDLNDSLNYISFIKIIESYPSSFLNYNSQKAVSSLEFFINTKHIDHVHEKPDDFQNKFYKTNIVFKGTNPNILEYNNSNQPNFNDLLNHFKKTQYIKKCL